MKLNQLSPTQGSNTKAYRKGRGPGSGSGKTAGRGHKGQKARSGGRVRIGFEGGQTPLYRRLPKRGFNQKRFQLQLVTLPLGRLQGFEDGTVVDLEKLAEAGVIKFSHKADGLKILGGGGEFNRKLTVRAHGFTAAAKAAIEEAGGTAEEV